MVKKNTVKKPKPGAKAKAPKPVLIPEAAAHVVQRELKFTPEQLAKMQAALDNGLSLKMSLGLHSKIWGDTGSSAKLLMKLPTGSDDIVDEPMQPPDGGGEIPTDPVDPPPEAKSGLCKGRRLVGARVSVYAVAVFHPEFSKG